MLPRRSRLARDRFEGANRGHKAHSPHFTVVVTRSAEGGCAVVVSKKVARRAVDRHLLKRRVLTVLRPWCLLGRYSIIVYARDGATTLPYRTLTEELTLLLSQVLPVA